MKKLLFLLFISLSMLEAASIRDLKITSDDIHNLDSNIHKRGVVARLNNYGKLIKSLEAESNDLIIITRVNQYFNKFKSVLDRKNYNKIDYWATRKEFILKGSGDCEDFVIAKYYTLIDLGINPAHLKPILSTYKGEAHLVLSYQKKRSDELLILDSINKRVKPATKRKDLKLLYTLSPYNFNENIKTSFKIANYKWNQVLKK